MNAFTFTAEPPPPIHTVFKCIFANKSLQFNHARLYADALHDLLLLGEFRHRLRGTNQFCSARMS